MKMVRSFQGSWMGLPFSVAILAGLCAALPCGGAVSAETSVNEAAGLSSPSREETRPAPASTPEEAKWMSLVNEARQPPVNGELDAVERRWTTACEYAEQAFGKRSFNHGVTLGMRAAFYRDTRNFEAATRDIQLALDILKSVSTTPDRKEIVATLDTAREQISKGAEWKGKRDQAETLLSSGDIERAGRLAADALAAAQTAFGEDDFDTAKTMTFLAEIRGQSGRFEEAEALMEKAQSLWIALCGKSDVIVHTHVAKRCAVLMRGRQYASASAVLEPILYGDEDYRLDPMIRASFCQMLAQALLNQRKNKEAVRPLLDVLNYVVEEKGSNTVDAAVARSALAVAYMNAGETPLAAATIGAGMDTFERLGETNRAEYASLLFGKSMLAEQQGNKAEALDWLKRADRILNAPGVGGGALKQQTAERMRALSGTKQTGGMYDSEAYQRGFATAQKGFALSRKMTEDPMSIGENDLGSNSWFILETSARGRARAGKQEEAEVLYARALKMAERQLPRDDPRLVPLMREYGTQLGYLKKYDEAQQVLLRARAICDLPGFTNRSERARTAKTLATLYFETGRYGEGEALLEQVRAFHAKGPSTDKEDDAGLLHTSGVIAMKMGNPKKALELIRAALALEEKRWGKDSALLVDTLTSLAAVEMHEGDPAAAEAHLQQALDNMEKSTAGWSRFIKSKTTPAHVETIDALSSLAAVYASGRKYAQAKELLEKAIALSDAGFGSDHLVSASARTSLAMLLLTAEGDKDQAEQLTRKALALQEKSLGPSHPDVGATVRQLAEIKTAQGSLAEALELFQRANTIEERMIRDIFSFCSESERMNYQDAIAIHQDEFLSFCLERLGADGAGVALNYLLRRKGLVLDSIVEDAEFAQLSANPELKDILQQLKSTKTRIAQLVMSRSKPGEAESTRSELERLAQTAESLEKELARKTARDRAGSAVTEIAYTNIIERLPPGGALVEYAKFFRVSLDAGRTNAAGGAARFKYVAIVLRKDGTGPVAIDLGDAVGIDGLVGWHRDMLAKAAEKKLPFTAMVGRSAAALEHAVWSPVKARLNGANRIYLSPDGDLHFVSFAGLCDKSGRYVLEDYDLAYVSTGRDLAKRLAQADKTWKKKAVLFGSPAFGGTPTDLGTDMLTRSAAAPNNAPDVRSFQGLRFPPLANTLTEVNAIERLAVAKGLEPEKYLGLSATEERMKSTAQPLILHLATHGFYLSAEGWTEGRGSPGTAVQRELGNPMHRSGLALAGANVTLEGKAGTGKEDGILTAEEVASLNLVGTELVVLSACETGLGEARGGEGVLGLRRAFVRAGAENLVMALWKVPDAETAALMKSFYSRYLSGMPPWRALIESQREALAAQRQSGFAPNPYAWAAFVASGMGSELPSNTPE